MCTSVPQTPARRTLINTSSSRIVGTGTFLSTKPGPAVSFTSAFIWYGLVDGGTSTRARLTQGAGKARRFHVETEDGDARSEDVLNLPAVDLNDRAGDEARAVRREKRDDRCH